MKLSIAAARAVLASVPALVSAGPFALTFERNWDYDFDVDGYHGGGAASDGSSGQQVGVTFTNVSACPATGGA